MTKTGVMTHVVTTIASTSPVNEPRWFDGLAWEADILIAVLRLSVSGIMLRVKSIKDA